MFSFPSEHNSGCIVLVLSVYLLALQLIYYCMYCAVCCSESRISTQSKQKMNVCQLTMVLKTSTRLLRTYVITMLQAASKQHLQPALHLSFSQIMTRVLPQFSAAQVTTRVLPRLLPICSEARRVHHNGNTRVPCENMKLLPAILL